MSLLSQGAANRVQFVPAMAMAMAKRRAPAADTAISPRREKQQETAQKVTRAAFALFGEKGFDATTTKEIADRAKVAHGTVFLVAQTKEGLLVAALKEHLRGVLDARSKTLPTRDVIAQIVHVMDGLFDFYARERGLSRAFLRAILFSTDPIAKALNEEHSTLFVARLAVLLDGGKTRGEVAPAVDSRIAGEAVMAVYMMQLARFLGSETERRAALGASFRAGLEVLFDGLAPRPTPPPLTRLPRTRSRPR